jgi:Fe-S oxidoreductase
MCPFLQEHGTPAHMARQLQHSPQTVLNAYACSLCSLCSAVCPEKLDPAQMFMDMRRAAVASGLLDTAPYRRILGYEALGISAAFTLYGLPQGADTVFFPGCTLAGTRPRTVQAAFSYLRTVFPRAGAVLACCSKPSHDLGMQSLFNERFTRLYNRLAQHGIKRVVTACPNCHKVFTTYAQDMEVVSIYEVLARRPAMAAGHDRSAPSCTAALHDPCPLREFPAIHHAARVLAAEAGIDVTELPGTRRRTLCCGEGGAVGAVRPDLAGGWTARRAAAAPQKRIFTYCAGCAGSLSAAGRRTDHLLDLVFYPRRTLAGRMKPARTPFSYLHRLWLKLRWRLLLTRGTDGK